jgi:hypothetical protein
MSAVEYYEAELARMEADLAHVWAKIAPGRKRAVNPHPKPDREAEAEANRTDHPELMPRAVGPLDAELRRA